jgi:hypothetical protein
MIIVNRNLRRESGIERSPQMSEGCVRGGQQHRGSDGPFVPRTRAGSATLRATNLATNFD